ncbi:MAG: hypothetical protein HWN68_10015 [Desulfobacterales bacterium]|nr:hypothetical protein [Desulfobacterales bacterium]
MDSKAKGIMLLGEAVVDLQDTDPKSVAYNIAADKTAKVFAVLIHSPTASLAGGTDFDIGSGANADTWKQTVDLSSMTSTDDYMYITASNVKYTIEPNSAAFGIKPITGATADAQATMCVFGKEE